MRRRGIGQLLRRNLALPAPAQVARHVERVGGSEPSVSHQLISPPWVGDALACVLGRFGREERQTRKMICPFQTPPSSFDERHGSWRLSNRCRCVAATCL